MTKDSAPSGSEYPFPSGPTGSLDVDPAEEVPSNATKAVAAPGERDGTLEAFGSRFVLSTHAYLREQIRNADQKAVFFFGASTALLAFMHSTEASGRWLKPPGTWNLVDTATFVGMAALAVAGLAALATVVPRLPGSKRGLVYFNAIAEYESDTAYAKDAMATSSRGLLTELAKHCHVLGRICRTKYRILRFAVWSALVGLGGTLFHFLSP